MTNVSFCSPLSPINYANCKSSPLRLLRRSSAISTMAEKSHSNDSEIDNKNPSVTLNFPSPLSPPLPLISKQMELDRAMSASSKSSLYSITRSELIFEDESLIVVNKPPGIYCESVLSSVHRLFQVSADSDEEGSEVKPLELHLANRLDRDTSGIMVITKLHKVAGRLVKAFTDHKVSKTYIALCIGPTPRWEKVRLKSGHGRSKFGAFRVYSASDIGRSLPGGSTVRDMSTSFEVLSINGQGKFREPNKSLVDEIKPLVIEDRRFTNNLLDDDEKDEVLIRAYPQSGRTHQIRLHCQFLGIPIRGDVKYEGVYEWKGNTYEAHCLHAESLSFDHPVTGVPVEFRAPLPLWAMQAILLGT